MRSSDLDELIEHTFQIAARNADTRVPYGDMQDDLRFCLHLF